MRKNFCIINAKCKCITPHSPTFLLARLFPVVKPAWNQTWGMVFNDSRDNRAWNFDPDSLRSWRLYFNLEEFLFSKCFWSQFCMISSATRIRWCCRLRHIPLSVLSKITDLLLVRVYENNSLLGSYLFNKDSSENSFVAPKSWRWATFGASVPPQKFKKVFWTGYIAGLTASRFGAVCQQMVLRLKKMSQLVNIRYCERLMPDQIIGRFPKRRVLQFSKNKNSASKLREILVPTIFELLFHFYLLKNNGNKVHFPVRSFAQNIIEFDIQ